MKPRSPQSLDKIGNRFSPAWQTGRARAIRCRYQAARIMPDEAVCKCGRRVLSPVIGITMKEGRAAYRGVQTCGSVWMCPVCAGYVAEGRRREVREIADAHCRRVIEPTRRDPDFVGPLRGERGGVIFMAAFTLAHHRFQTAAELRRAVSSCWSKVIGGKAWMLSAARSRCAGWVRALEVTHGKHGWHPHIHAAFFLTMKRTRLRSASGFSSDGRALSNAPDTANARR